MRALVRMFFSLAVLASLGTLTSAQQPNCPLPPVLQPLPAGMNMFSDQQEADLGDAMAEKVNPTSRSSKTTR